VADDPQVRHLGTFARAVHPTMGEVIGIKSPIQLDGKRRAELPPPPALNADAAAIAAEFGFQA
jgi:formyl-CoA transferase